MTTADNIDTFASQEARTKFWIGALGAFLCFSMITSQALLPIVLGSQGIPETLVGYAMTSSGVTAIPFGLIAGLLISRHGPLIPLVGGMLVLLFAHLAYEFMPLTHVTVFLPRLAHGVGAGLFLPSVIAFASSLVQGENRTLMFGIFTSSIPGANLIGPTLGELYLNSLGVQGFFIVTALPGVMAFVLFVWLLVRYNGIEEKYDAGLQYRGLMRRRKLAAPLIGMAVIGSLWGYVISFITVALITQEIAIVLFFAPMTLFIFVGRFAILALVRKRSRPIIGAVSITAVSAALIIAGIAADPVATVFAGAAFGTGYALAYPTFTIWISEAVGEELQGQSAALSNTVFNLFMYLAPGFCALGLAVLTITQYQILLGVGMLAAGCLAMLVCRELSAGR